MYAYPLLSITNADILTVTCHAYWQPAWHPQQSSLAACFREVVHDMLCMLIHARRTTRLLIRLRVQTQQP